MDMEMWQSKEIDQLAAAIVKAQMRMKPAVKDCTNPFFKSKYADMQSVWIAVTPFCEEGIAITQMPMPCGQGETALDTQLTHVSGQWMRSRLIMPVPKNDPQGIGSAITYARRYALGCMTGVVTEEDDDGNAASQPKKSVHYETATSIRCDAPQYLPGSGLSKPAATGAPTPVPATESVAAPPVVTDSPKFPFGAWKGKPLTECPMGELQSAITFIEKSIADPSKAKFKDRNIEMVMNLQAEITRREETLELETQ